MKERIDRHKDGNIKAKGHMMDGELEGYWEWYRLDGSKLRSGYFKSGKQVGEWTTYERHWQGREGHELPKRELKAMRVRSGQQHVNGGDHHRPSPPHSVSGPQET